MSCSIALPSMKSLSGGEGRGREGGRMAAGRKDYRIMVLLTHDEKD